MKKCVERVRGDFDVGREGEGGREEWIDPVEYDEVKEELGLSGV